MQWLMLQQEQPEDFVIATGEQRSVRQFVEQTCRHLEIDIQWEGSGVDERGFDPTTGQCLVSVDPRYFRPTEVDTLLADPTKARERLGWTSKVSFEELVREMAEEDLKLAERDALIARNGYRGFAGHE
jgi:GDPmannose 4,6-dehydratase